MPVRYYYSVNDMLRYANPDINIHKDTEIEWGDIHWMAAKSFMSVCDIVAL